MHNLLVADVRNYLECMTNPLQHSDPTLCTVHGITRFSAMTASDFNSKYTGLIDFSLTSQSKYQRKHEATVTQPDATLGLVDWTNVYNTPIKNQGGCGR